MNKHAAIAGLRFYALRFALACVFWFMAVAVENTNLQNGVAQKYGALGIEAAHMRHYIALGLFTSAVLVIMFARWYVDIIILLPNSLLFYFSFLYYKETQVLTAPVFYGAVWFLTLIILYARNSYERI